MVRRPARENTPDRVNRGGDGEDGGGVRARHANRRAEAGDEEDGGDVAEELEEREYEVERVHRHAQHGEVEHLVLHLLLRRDALAQHAQREHAAAEAEEAHDTQCPGDAEVVDRGLDDGREDDGADTTSGLRAK